MSDAAVDCRGLMNQQIIAEAFDSPLGPGDVFADEPGQQLLKVGQHIGIRGWVRSPFRRFGGGRRCIGL